MHMYTIRMLYCFSIYSHWMLTVGVIEMLWKSFVNCIEKQICEYTQVILVNVILVCLDHKSKAVSLASSFNSC